jgi:hypothetical protein
VGFIDGPAPTPAPESGSDDGNGAQSVPVAFIESEPALFAAVGAKMTASVWAPAAGIEKLGFETVKGAGAEPVVPAESVTTAAPVPVFLTLKFWDVA